MAPAGTPAEIVTRLTAEVTKLLHAPDVRDQLVGLGYIILAGSPQNFSAYLKAETEKWAGVIKAAGTRLD